MKEIVHKLVKLQEVTGIIFQFENERENLPRELVQKKKILNQDRLRLSQQEKTIQIFLEKLKKNTKRVAELKLEIDKLKEKEKNVQTQKEYLALDSEQHIRKEEIDELETVIRTAEEELDKNQKLMTDIQSSVESLEKTLVIEDEEISKKLVHIEDQLSEYKKTRERLIPGIPKQVLTNYERIARCKDGVGIVPVIDHICTGCNIGLSPLIINKLRKTTEIIYCLSCSRILYIPNGRI